MIVLERLPFKLRKLLNKDYINKLNNCCLTECLWLFYKEQTSCSAFCDKRDLILIFFCEIFLWVSGKPYHIFHQLSFLKAKNIQFPQLLPNKARFPVPCSSSVSFSAPVPGSSLLFKIVALRIGPSSLDQKLPCRKEQNNYSCKISVDAVCHWTLSHCFHF